MYFPESTLGSYKDKIESLRATMSDSSQNLYPHFLQTIVFPTSLLAKPNKPVVNQRFVPEIFWTLVDPQVGQCGVFWVVVDGAELYDEYDFFALFLFMVVVSN